MAIPAAIGQASIFAARYDPYPVLYAPGTEEPNLSKGLEVSEEEPDGRSRFLAP
jgi:hypothetical protein